MSTEPETLTLAQVARRAVDVVDHEVADDALTSFLARFEDRDEPVTAVEQPDELFAEAAGSIDPDDPALQMAAAVAGYLSFKRDQLDAQPEDLLRRAAEAEFDGSPPPEVAGWLSERLCRCRGCRARRAGRRTRSRRASRRCARAGAPSRPARARRARSAAAS